MKFDDILYHLGEFGRYQKRLYILLCLPAISVGSFMMGLVLIMETPKHRYFLFSLSLSLFWALVLFFSLSFHSFLMISRSSFFLFLFLSFFWFYCFSSNNPRIFFTISLFILLYLLLNFKLVNTLFIVFYWNAYLINDIYSAMNIISFQN